MAPATKVFLRIVGALLVLGVTTLIAGIWWATSLSQSERTDTARASATFDQVRARFPGIDPAFEIRETRLVVMREPAARGSSTVPAAAHILVWQPRDRMLSRVALPMWMSKVATEPLPLDALAGIGDQGFGGLMEAKRAGNELNIRISDLERYGRTLLLDGITADGKHVMMWNE